MGQSWYMSSEFQMFLMTPFVLLPMHWIGKKWGVKWSMAFNVALLAGFTLTILILAIIKDWPVTVDLAGA